MSSYSYDNLPEDIVEKLNALQLELEEGDITQKGYEKKKNKLLAPYISCDDNTEYTEQSIHDEDDQRTEVLSSTETDNNIVNDEMTMDLGDEPSAAEVTDFLDFLPSPTHSPKDPHGEEGAQYMVQNHSELMQQQQSAADNYTYYMNDNHVQQQQQPSSSLMNRQPQPQQQQFPSPRPFMPDNYRPNPTYNNNRQIIDPLMGPSRSAFVGGNMYPAYPAQQPRPMYNRPPPPPPPSQNSNVPSSPIYRPQPLSPVYGFRPGMPTSPVAAGSGFMSNLPPPPTPTRMIPPFAQHHRTPSLESKHEHPALNNMYPPFKHHPQQPDMYTDNESLTDWETSSVSLPMRQQGSTNGPDPSVTSTSGRMRQSTMSHQTSYSNYESNSVAGTGIPRRSRPVNANTRSRYRENYMATSFKAIEPAPRPRLLFSDPADQNLLADLAGQQMAPIQGRPIPFKLLDSDQKVSLTDDFSNLAEILRYRATKSSARLKEAFILVDEKGKESINMNWDKINAKAEKIARTIKQRGIKSGERVALIYRKSDVIEFIPALFGCFFAGVTAVPVNATDDLSELTFILNLTNIYLILTTEYNHKAFIKEMQTKSTELPPSVSWCTTNNLGLWYPTKKEKDYLPIVKMPELAYIEYAKSSSGELKGVTVTHKSIMEQCAGFHAATTETDVTVTEDENVEVKPKRSAKAPETVVTYFEPRQQIGLILSILYAVYAGNVTVFAGGFIIDTPAVWIYVLSKYKATMALADYTALKNITKYYSYHAKEVKSFSKKVTPDLSSLRHLIIDTYTIHPETNEYIADKLLRPLGNSVYPINVVRPVLSLPEYGGKIISMRDGLGPASTKEYIQTDESITLEDGQQITRPGLRTTKTLSSSQSKEIYSCLLNAQDLKEDKITVLAAGPDVKMSENASNPGTVRKESFGFCMPSTTVAIVDPETTTLCQPNKVGEVWVDTSYVGGGLWGLSMHTEAIFHAKPIAVSQETLQPELCEGAYLRTGLSGAIINGRLFILGPYEERIRQQRLDAEFGVEDVFYASDLTKTITNRTHIEQCAVFEILVKDQHLPVIACEAEVTGRPELASIATQIDEALIEIHGLRPYIIFFVKPNGLPRHLIHGRRFIHSLLTKSYFLRGYLTITHIKMDVDRTVFNLAENLDTSGNNFWALTYAYETAVRTGVIIPYPQQQHTSMEKVTMVKDERSGFDLSTFTNIIDILNHRATMFPDDTAYTVATQAGANTVNTKSYSWKKISYKSATVATLLAKKGLKSGIKALIMVPFGIEYIFSVYACLSMGIVPVPLEPIDVEVQKQHPHRIKEFAETFVEVTKDLGITAVLVNSTSDNVLRNNIVKSVIREASIKSNYRIPESINVSKSPKHHKMLGKESGFTVRLEWIRRDRKSPTVILVQNRSDGRRYYSVLSHETILNQCRAQIKTCQMRYQRSIVVTGLGTYEGLGILHALFCGVYVGCNTTLIPSADFYINPAFFFESLQRFKTKDVFVTNALVQFAVNRMKNYAEYKHLNLKGVQNLMLAADDRPRPHMYQYMANFFYKHKVEKGSFNSIYGHAANPMITTRSYMVMEPITIAVDSYWLRQGVVRANVNPNDLKDSSRAIILQDSGIVPSNTMVAIVNPETRTLCPSNVIGEIWVSSDSNVKSFYNYNSNDAAHAHVFEATIAGSDPNIKYLRTGDVGFLWNVRRRIDSRNTMQHSMFEEGQCLYVLGSLNDIITRNGLIYFPVDVEYCIERSENTIAGSIVFQCDDEIVVIASVKLPENARETINEHARAVTALIVNAVLDNHFFLVDTVVIVHPSNFPRSKFGEKLRRRAVISYAKKKLSAVYVKRITNQHESLTLPQWTQSEVSFNDQVNNDTYSIQSGLPSTRSPTENTIIEGQLPPPSSPLIRRDTINSRVSSLNNTGSSELQSPTI